MSSAATALLVFGCVFGAAVAGMLLRTVLPQHHLSAETKDTVKLSMSLLSTISALVLGLLIASAKGTYDTEKSAVVQMAARIAFLDRTLAFYGPEAANAREQLRHAVGSMVARMWPDSMTQHAQLDPTSASGAEALYDAIQALSPQNDVQRSIKSQAVGNAIEIGQMRWLLFESSNASISTTMLVVVVTWLALIFLSFGLFAPSNGTVIVTLMVGALSVSGAIFLILELDQPFGGVIQISNKPMSTALSHLGP